MTFKALSLALAATIGLFALSAAAPVSAAPFAPNLAAAQATVAGDAVTEVGRRHRHRRWHRGHRRGHIHLHFGRGYVRYGYRPRCRIAKVRVYNPRTGRHYWERRRICGRHF